MQEVVSMYTGLKLWLLFFLFCISFVGILEAAEPNIVPRLEADPDRYLRYVQNGVLFLFLPALGEICFIIVVHVGRGKIRSELLDWWSILLTFGIVFFSFGVFGIIYSIHSYYGAINYALLENNSNIQFHIWAVYTTAAIGLILWMLAGVLFILLPLHRRSKRAH